LLFELGLWHGHVLGQLADRQKQKALAKRIEEVTSSGQLRPRNAESQRLLMAGLLLHFRLDPGYAKCWQKARRKAAEK